jgi:chromosome segregation ATPase
LQAHLSETNRRLQDTQRLGTSLLQQQQELSQRLKDVETQEDEAEVSPELRKRLAEIEKEHNDIGREIAKALLAPKARAVSPEDRIAAESSETFSSNATASPSKVSVPSRKQRNRPLSRAHDVQFAADISTSLLAQVRQLQAALSERDESLKSLSLEKIKLEHDAEGLSQRFRALNESEQRCKDENWNLETQTHELIAASKEAAEREKKLNASLAAALAEKSKAQNDLEELTVAHGQLGEELC